MLNHDAPCRHRHRHQLAAHDRRARPPRSVVRGHRPREGNGPPGRRRPRRPRAHARSDARGAPGAVEVPAAGRIAPRRRDRSPSRRARCAKPRTAASSCRPITAADRHPRRASFPAPRKRGSSTWRRSTASASPAKSRSSSTSAAAASRSRAAPGRAIEIGPQLQARRDPADRAVRQERSARRRATSASWCGTSTPKLGEYLDQIAQRRLRSRHRHVGHDPQPRRVAAADQGRAGRRAAAQPPRLAPSSCAACARTLRRSSLEKRLRVPGLEPRRADLVGRRRDPARHDPPAARRRRDHALRPVAARRAGPRLHRAPPQGDRAGRSLSRRPAPQRHRAGRALQLLARARAAGRAARDRRSSTRRAAIHGLTDREREWLEYAALLHDIGVHISYERHHKHSYYLIKNGDLRGFEPDEIETIALVARYHRRATPKRRHDGFGDLPAQAPAHGPHARGDPAAGRKPRPQPRADDHGRRAARSRRRRPAAAADRRATPSSSCGRPARHAAPFERLIGKPLRIEVSRTRLC